DRVREQQGKVESAERTLQAYREKEGLVNLEERQTLVEQKLTTLSAAALNARTERISKEALYNQMRTLGSSQLDSFPLVMANGVGQQLRAQVAELQKEQARLAENLGDKHPDMIRVRAQTRAAEDKLREEMHTVVRSVETDYRTAASREASLQAGLEAAKQE